MNTKLLALVATGAVLASQAVFAQQYNGAALVTEYRNRLRELPTAEADILRAVLRKDAYGPAKASLSICRSYESGVSYNQIRINQIQSILDADFRTAEGIRAADYHFDIVNDLATKHFCPQFANARYQ